MNEITMLPIEKLAHHPENPRLDLGDLTELTASIRANGIMQNLTVVFEPSHGMTAKEWNEACDQYGRNPTEELRRMMDSKITPDRYLVVIGNRRFEAAKQAGLTELPCAISDMDHNEQIATMLQENMQRSDLTIYEQAKGIQTMMDLGFTKEQVQEKTGFSRSTIDKRLAVAKLPGKETKHAVSMGYDLTDLVEISRIENRDAQEELLRGTPDREGAIDRNWLRQRIASFKREEERNRQKKRLLPEIERFAKPMTSKQENERFGNKWEHLNKLDIELKADAVVKQPKEENEYYWRESWGRIEIWIKVKREKHVKTEAEIALEKKRSDAKELNDRMRENRQAFVRGWTQTKAQEEKLAAKLPEYLFGWKNSYLNGDFFSSFHSWGIGLFRDLCGMPREEERDKDESLLDEIRRRQIPMGRAILAWMLCGGLKADDRQGYASQYNGTYEKDKDLDNVYTVLTEAGYRLTEEEQQWKDGTHPFYGR